MVGRAAAVLSGRRPGWRLAGLLTALVAWDALAAELPGDSGSLDVALVAIVLIPAAFAVAWLFLPFAGARGLLPVGLGFVALCVVLDLAGLGAAFNVAKLVALTLLGFWFPGSSTSFRGSCSSRR